MQIFLFNFKLLSIDVHHAPRRLRRHLKNSISSAVSFLARRLPFHKAVGPTESCFASGPKHSERRVDAPGSRGRSRRGHADDTPRRLRRLRHTTILL